MNKKGAMFETLGKWIIGAVAVFIILTFLVRHSFKEVFDVGLAFAEKAKSVEKYQGTDSSGEEEELRRIQERFLQDISGKAGKECLIRNTLSSLGNKMLEFSKSGPQTRVSGILLAGKERQQKINTQFFSKEICVIDAGNFRGTYDVGDDRCFESNREEPLYSKSVSSFSITDTQIILQTARGEQRLDYNKEYLFKPDENKFCFIPTHRVYVGSVSNRCRKEEYSIYIDNNEKLVNAVGLC